jgi:branched-subunit amino acid ABC-type transport system permease component
MNKLLYALIGLAVAGAIGASMFNPAVRHQVKFDEPNLATACVCLLLIAGGILFLTHTPLGRRLKASADKRARDEDDRVRTTPGKVRRPPTH